MIQYTCDFCRKATLPEDVIETKGGEHICKACVTVRIQDMAKALYLCNTAFIRMLDKDTLMAMQFTLSEFFVRMNQSPKEILDGGMR